MNVLRGTRIAATLALGTALLFSGGCGFKNLPVPPDKVVPSAITDLRYTLDSKGVKLTWTYPTETIKGTEITDLSSFELYLAEVPLKDYCGTCPVPFSTPMELAGGVPAVQGQKRTATYENTHLTPGNKYFFKVRSRTSWWASSNDSNIVTFVWQVPANAPQQVTVVATDHQVSLKWPAISTLQDGSPAPMPVVYQVSRSIDGKKFEKLGEPVSSPSFIDREVRNGQKYSYKVQSLMRQGKDILLGGESEVVGAAPVDRAPLVTPSGVTVVQADGNNKVYWDKMNAKGLSAVKVYRRSADQDTYELVGTVTPENTIFIDKTAKADGRYYYAVTAVSSDTPPVESGKSREATFRH